jgi:DNA-binding transcriptional MerR regulator
MGWSTREIAQLAGTSLRTVRHYHELGLLDEPDRLSNGYKMYRTEHLVRLVQIRRLTGLGFSLAAIARMSAGPEAEPLDSTLADVDADLAASIARLQEARAEIAELRRRPVPTDLPVGLSAAATDAKLSRADRSLFAVLAQVVGADNSPYWEGLLQDSPRDAAGSEFDALPADADETTREQLAQRLVPLMRELNAKHPSPPTTLENAAAGPRVARETMVAAMLDLYNPAQLDVFVRIWKAIGLI